MAFVAFVSALLRCPALPVETDHDALLALTETAIGKGTVGLRDELDVLYRHAWQQATAEERQYLPVIAHRIAHGSLAEQMAGRYRQDQAIEPILAGMSWCLRQNMPYGMD
jgi:hypothetical protein